LELYTGINECKITNWIERLKNRADWEKSGKGAKVRIVLRRRRRIRRNGRKRGRRTRRRRRRRRKRRRRRR